MTDRALEELAARVEALQGPDREVDGVIHEAVTSFPPRNGGVGWSFGTLVVPTFPGWKELPFYTASIDAAMSLVPEGAGHWPQIIMTGTNPNNPTKQKERVEIWVRGHAKPFRSNAATPALALTAACLRAIAGKEG